MQYFNEINIGLRINQYVSNLKYILSRIYTGDFFATRFEDFLCVKISLAEWLLTQGETRLPRSHSARIAAV